MWLTWQQAAAIVAMLAVGVRATRGVQLRWVQGARTFCRELALVLALYAIWQYAHGWTRTQTAGGLDNGRWVLDAEQALRLPSELALQRRFLPHPLWVQAMNGYYAIVHVPALGAFLLWLYFRHRDRYGRIRNALALLTGACLLIQMIPVAPPRMLPGFVDTGLLYEQSVYGRGGAGIANQLSAMPSVHVAWAATVTVGVLVVSRSRWRWLVVAHLVLTVLAITVTANHYWLDGIVAVALLGLAWALAAAGEVVVRRVAASHAAGRVGEPDVIDLEEVAPVAALD